MTQLQEITIKVPPTIAEAYNQFNDEKNKKLSGKLPSFYNL
jgi:hypothetical protein